MASGPATQIAFKEGVKMSAAPILHSLFTVRTNQLFERYNKEQNFSYLSGLLIGSELMALKDINLPIVICTGDNLFDSYKLAVEALSFKNVSFTSPELIGKATVIGQVTVYKNLIVNKLINE